MYNIEIFAEYVPSKQKFLADLCSRAFINQSYYNQFNELLSAGTIVLENVIYTNLDFEYDF